MFSALSRPALQARWSPRWMPRLALAALVAAAIQLSSAQEVLSLERALRLAQDRSRQLPAQESASAAARAMALAAAQLPDPVLKAGITNLPIDGPDRFSLTRDFMTMRSIGVMQEFTRDEKRKARAARFEREAETAEAGRAVALADLRRETAMAWLDRHFQERSRDLLLAQRAESALQIEAAEAAYRGGRGAQADVFAARSAVAQIDDRIRQVELQIATAKTRLARWVGAVGEGTLGEAPELNRARFDTARLETQLEHHPRLALMARQEFTARAEADIAQANKRSDWSVEVMYSQRGPAYSNMVSINLSVPLQWDQKNRQDREVASRLALAEQMRAQREEATRQVVAETLTWLQQWRSYRDRLAHYDSTLIPLAGERTRAAGAAYRGGNSKLAAVLEARRMEIDTRLERLRLETESARLWVQLEYLIPAEHAVAGAEGAASAKEQQR